MSTQNSNSGDIEDAVKAVKAVKSPMNNGKPVIVTNAQKKRGFIEYGRGVIGCVMPLCVSSHTFPLPARPTSIKKMKKRASNH